jgi:gas vesicle protein
MKSGKVLLGILAGIAGGAILGILFAPEKGVRTRKNIMNKSGDYADDLKEKFNDYINSMTNKYEKTWHEAESMVAEGKAKYGELMADGKTKSDVPVKA